MRNSYVFTGCDSPFHSGVYVSGHFNDLAAVAFLPTPPISLHEEAHPVNTYDVNTYEIRINDRYPVK